MSVHVLVFENVLRKPLLLVAIKAGTKKFPKKQHPIR